MKFWILTAMTLALAMIAGDAMAQFDVSVSANTNRMRHLKVSRNDLEPGAGQIQMVFWIYPDFELDRPGMAPAILGSAYNLNVDAPYLGMSTYFPDCNLATVSRQIYALYESVGDERRRVQSFNVELANFGTFDGHYQTKGYLGDPDEPDQGDVPELVDLAPPSGCRLKTPPGEAGHRRPSPSRSRPAGSHALGDGRSRSPADLQAMVHGGRP